MYTWMDRHTDRREIYSTGLASTWASSPFNCCLPKKMNKEEKGISGGKKEMNQNSYQAEHKHSLVLSNSPYWDCWQVLILVGSIKLTTRDWRLFFFFGWGGWGVVLVFKYRTEQEPRQRTPCTPLGCLSSDSRGVLGHSLQPQISIVMHLTEFQKATWKVSWKKRECAVTQLSHPKYVASSILSITWVYERLTEYPAFQPPLPCKFLFTLSLYC